MTEPTAEEIREMAAWAGAATDPTCDGDYAWNDGRLMFAALCKLVAEYGGQLCDGLLSVLCEESDGQWDFDTGEPDGPPCAIWAACREVRK